MVQFDKKVVVVGNGMVGHYFVEQLQQQCPQAQITVLSGESRLAYDRVHLSSFFEGKTVDDLALTDEARYRAWGVSYRLNAQVKVVDRQAKKVVTEAGEAIDYDVLVLATGSYPFVPPIPGADQAHCLVYRTIEDLDAIQQSAASSRVGVVIGGGLLGLEAANALKQTGLETHIVEFAPQLMAVQLDTGGGQLLRDMIQQLGVQVHTRKATSVIRAGKTHRYCLEFQDGGELETDLVLFSAGIRPQDALATQAGLSVGERGGIVIDDHCRSSDRDIYSIGECALWNGQVFGLVAPGYQMARTVVAHLQGQTQPFSGADMSTKLKLLGVDVASIGDAHGKTPGSQSYIFENQPEQIYQKIVVDEAGERLLGAVLVGDCQQYDALLQYCLNGIALPESPACLMLPASDDQVASSDTTLPESATLCSCHNVSKGDVLRAMDAGISEFAGIKSETKACTGCGGCMALVKSVFDAELSQRGIEVKRDICEHFPYSRQELFHLIHVNEIKSFDALLARYGQGLGCDICKPAIGSILASCWNDYVLEPEHVSLQDTNDAFLGNIQKDGTYSVVPRVAGGEITADKLITLGEIAKQHNLYCKITGGQRIDLLGARLDQLPVVWQSLIDAGFETGHAYAKSLRTVKSCVGSTWCRYGVQDSVTQAIDLENRYKGLRAPHKIKMAVSGCTRECAEAQSKDIGVIATERGWNLYVCGNGGMKPRHADLFATDLDTETLIQLIDRTLMFYVRTADRLQRTSVWLENLEGGIDYLKKVIIEDHLGICDELERQMQHIIGTYQCEWQRTLNDQEVLQRFQHFVNSTDVDEGIVFAKKRQQIYPQIQTIDPLAIANTTV